MLVGQMMIYIDLPMEEYLASPAFGSSLFRKLLESPAEFKAAQRKRNTDTKATLLGTAMHTMILEPAQFFKRYSLQPADWGPRNKGEGYKLWNEFKSEADGLGKIPITWEDAELLRDVDRVAENIPQLAEQLTFGKTEVSAFATIDGIEFKARVDLVGSRVDDAMTPCLWDLKTTSEDIADDTKLFNVLRKYRYDFQAAQYLEVYNAAGMGELTGNHEYVEDFGWILVSTNKASPVVRIVQAPKELLSWAKSDFQKACDTYNYCLANGTWFGVKPIVTELYIPPWARELFGNTSE